MAGKTVTRTCVGCKELFAQDELIRYVLTPERKVVPDLKGRLPGRGCYTCLKSDCINTAVEKKQFNRAFKGRNIPPEKDELQLAVQDALKNRILNLIGMARKSSLVVSGSSLVLSGLPKGSFSLIIQAQDMIGGTGQKIRDAARRNNVNLSVLFDKEQLGVSIGKDWRSVLGFKSSGLTETLQQELYRYTELVGEN